MERGTVEWNSGTVEWASMTNDPVPHQLICVCVRTNIDSEQSQKGERRIGQECIHTRRNREAKSTENTAYSLAVDLDLLLLPADRISA